VGLIFDTVGNPAAEPQSDPGERASAHGLRRVDYVRLLVGGERIRAELVGVGYRLPTAVPVSLPIAAKLIADGTPSVTRHVTSGPVRAEKSA
jgi:hypothetical protein